MSWGPSWEESSDDFQRFSASFCVLILVCSALLFPVLASSAWRCDVMKMMHSLRRTAYWLFTLSATLTAPRMLESDCILKTGLHHPVLIMDGSCLLSPTGADSQLICHKVCCDQPERTHG